MVGAPPDIGGAQRGGSGAGAHWHTRRDRGPRGSGRARGARRAVRRATASDAQPGATRRRERRRRMTAPRFRLADELLRRFAASLRSSQLYSPGHPIIGRNLESLSAAVQLFHSLQPAIVIGLVGDEVIVDDMPMAKADTLGPFVRRLQQSGVERITIDRGVTTEEITTFIDAV